MTTHSTGGSAEPDPSAASVPWWAAFGHRAFIGFQSARMFSQLGMQMQSVAVGWQIYAITHRPIDLAWVGLAQFFPAVGLSLVTGHVADRFDRRTVVLGGHAAMAVLSLGLWTLARSDARNVGWIYVVLVAVGTARAFLGSANQPLLASVVPTEHFGNAVAWASSLMQTAIVVGPSLGGAIYALTGGPSAVYGWASVCSVGALLCIATLPSCRAARRPNAATPGGASAAKDRPGAKHRLFAKHRLLANDRPEKPRPGAKDLPRRPRVTRASLFAGFRYVASNRIVLGATTLDLFAVLLGGATALLPVYSRDVLRLGPFGLGALRSAPAIGAGVTGVLLATRPIQRAAGAKMLACVALFGVATIVFGLSRSFAVSLVALIVSGAADMVSVYVRQALVQLATPDAMRGRVSAVNMVFIGASNELGEFESGLTAQWLGTVRSVVLGGVGTLVVVALWVWRFPELRRVNRLTDVLPPR